MAGIPAQSDLVVALLRAAEDELAARAEQAQLSAQMLRAAEAENRRKDGQLALLSKQLRAARADLQAQESSIKDSRAEAATLRAALRAATKQRAAANGRSTESQRTAADRTGTRKGLRGPLTPAGGRAGSVPGVARCGLSHGRNPSLTAQATPESGAEIGIGAEIEIEAEIEIGAEIEARAAREAGAEARAMNEAGNVAAAAVEAGAAGEVEAGGSQTMPAWGARGGGPLQSADSAHPARDSRSVPPPVAATHVAPSPPAFSVPERLSPPAARAASATPLFTAANAHSQPPSTSSYNSLHGSSDGPAGAAGVRREASCGSAVTAPRRSVAWSDDDSIGTGGNPGREAGTHPRPCSTTGNGGADAGGLFLGHGGGAADAVGLAGAGGGLGDGWGGGARAETEAAAGQLWNLLALRPPMPGPQVGLHPPFPPPPRYLIFPTPLSIVMPVRSFPPPRYLIPLPP